jgi:competence protein ComGC
MPICKTRLKGFTLAELLIILLILAEIATFTIPKILYTYQQQQKIAIFKETIAALSASVYNFCISPASSSNPNPYLYTIGVINSVKQCPTNSLTEGCTTNLAGGDFSEPGFTLHNGALITGLRNSSQPREVVEVDWNGNAGANTNGDDEIKIAINYTQATVYNGAEECRIAPFSGDAASITLYQTVFQ